MWPLYLALYVVWANCSCIYGANLGAVDPVGFEEVRLNRSRVAIAQLVARRSHNPKVVSSNLTGGILLFFDLSFMCCHFPWKLQHY